MTGWNLASEEYQYNQDFPRTPGATCPEHRRTGVANTSLLHVLTHVIFRLQLANEAIVLHPQITASQESVAGGSDGLRLAAAQPPVPLVDQLATTVNTPTTGSDDTAP